MTEPPKTFEELIASAEADREARGAPPVAPGDAEGFAIALRELNVPEDVIQDMLAMPKHELMDLARQMGNAYIVNVNGYRPEAV